MNENEENMKKTEDESIEEERIEEQVDGNKEFEELNNKLLRLQADFVNFKKRAEKEKENTIHYALESFGCSLLPIIDNFQRAMESEVDKNDNFYKGVEMIYEQLIKALNDNGIEEVKALGEEFDPNFHHAVFMEESDEYEAGKVTEVLQTGYMLKDRIIRPAMVKVAK